MEKYTVVIPSRNSLSTLRYTLQTCLSQTYPNFEIIISDNFSSDGTAEYISQINDKRIKFFRTERVLSMTDNFEFALSKAGEGYIMCIGADDGLMPDAIEYVDHLRQQYQTLAIACQYAHYFWPDVPVANHGQVTLNSLNVCKSSAVLRQSSEWLKKTLAFQTTMYVCDLPGVYYGFVHRDVINRSIKNNIYFRSITPDAYSAFATASTVDTYTFSYRPFVIAGISGRSNGLSQSLGGEISKNFVTENTRSIHHLFSFCTAFEVIMGEAFFQYADAFPERVRTGILNINLMLKKALASRNDINSKEITEAVRSMCRIHKIEFDSIENKKISSIGKFFKRSVRMLGSMILNGRKKFGVKDSAEFGIKNVFEASILLQIMEMQNQGKKIETHSSRFFIRLRNRFYFRNNDNSL